MAGELDGAGLQSFECPPLLTSTSYTLSSNKDRRGGVAIRPIYLNQVMCATRLTAMLYPLLSVTTVGG